MNTMSSSIRLVFLVIVSILLSCYNALGSPLQLRVERMINAQSDEYNHFKHEALVKNKAATCTGSIISNIHVLTAAHCVITTNATHVQTNGLTFVTVGITNVYDKFESQTVRLVETIYTLKYYFLKDDNSDDDFRNLIADIAVLKLNYELGLGGNPRIKPLNLPTQEYEEYENMGNRAKNTLIFTGLGVNKITVDPKTEHYVPLSFPDYLQYSWAEVKPPSWCPSIGNVNLKLCAQLLERDAAVCGGDSGGALLYLEGRTIIGVASHSHKACRHEMPATYTRVFPYVSFIKSAMNDTLETDMRRLSFNSDSKYKNTLRAHAYKYFHTLTVT